MPRDGGEIGPSETKVRRKRANQQAAPRDAAPASAPIGGNANGEGQLYGDTQGAPALAELITNLTALQRRRQFCIKRQSQADRSMDSMIALAIGFRIDDTEADRKHIYAQAKAHRLAVEKGGEGQPRFDTQPTNALSAITPLILASAAERAKWDKLRKAAEKEMERAQMPSRVRDFQKAIAGFGERSLAIIVAEAHTADAPTIGDYRTVSGLWKHCMLAVENGARQWKGAKSRRAELWVISDSMIRYQIAGDKDENGNNPIKSGKPVAVPAHPTGPYGEVYYRRRAHTAPRVEATADLPDKIMVGGKEATNPAKWTPLRCANDAKRIMTKALLRDLWRVWRGLPPKGAHSGSPTETP